MTGHRHDRDDLVDAFFAAEREDITPLPADDLRWQRIVRESRPAVRRTRWAGYGAGAAAAALVVGSLWGVSRWDALTGPNHDLAGPAGQTRILTTQNSSGVTGTSPAQEAPTQPQSRPVVTSAIAAPVDTPVPASFKLTSMSNAGGNMIYALGEAPCGAKACPVLISSIDNGAHWQVVTRFTGHGFAKGVGGSGADQIGEVRFANQQVGWVFGGAVLQTTDGGRTWNEYRHPGKIVNALATNATDVALVTSDGCGEGGCTNVQVSRAPLSATSATRVGTVPAADGPFRRFELGWRGETAYLSIEGAWRIDSNWAISATSLERADVNCGGGVGMLTIVPADSLSVRYVVCSADYDRGPFHIARRSSAGEWSVERTAPTLNGRGYLYGAAVVRGSDEHIVLATAGGGGIQVTHDEGRTWSAARGVNAEGWRWLGAPGGSTFYAIADDAGAGYYVSKDAGATFTWVSVVAAQGAAP